MTTKKAQTKKSRTLFIVADESGSGQLYKSLKLATTEMSKDEFEYSAVFEVKVVAAYDMETPKPEVTSGDIDKTIDWLEIK